MVHATVKTKQNKQKQNIKQTNKKKPPCIFLQNMRMFKKNVEDLSNIKTFPTLTNDTAILNELLAAFCTNLRKDVSFLLPFEDVHGSYA